MEKTYFDKICKETFSVFHNSNCHDAFQVRLIKKGGGLLDNIQYYGITNDIVGYGKNLEEAAKNAWLKKYGK